MPKQIIFPVIIFLHDLFTAVWIGGMIVLLISVLPAVRSSGVSKEERMSLVRRIHARLRWPVYAAIVILTVTGILLGRRPGADAGFMDFSSRYSTLLSVKHLLVIGMVIVTAARSVLLTRGIPKEGEGREAPAANKVPASKSPKILAAMLAGNVLLGVGVLFLSALLASAS